MQEPVLRSRTLSRGLTECVQSIGGRRGQHEFAQREFEARAVTVVTSAATAGEAYFGADRSHHGVNVTFVAFAASTVTRVRDLRLNATLTQ
jgi:hypothetical protein